jgi:hypothetical protein
VADEDDISRKAADALRPGAGSPLSSLPISTEPNRPAEDPVPFKWPWEPTDAVRVSGESAVPSKRSGISRAPAPSPRINPNSGPVEPPKSKVDHDREDREHRRASLEAAFEQHSTETPPPPAPPDPPIHGPEGPLPRTWPEAVPYLVWVVLILGFGLECVAHLLKADWLQALFAFLGMVGLAAMMLHWTQIRGKFSDTRWLVAAAMLLLLGLILSPFVEERRWPFSAWFAKAPPSTGFSQQEVDAKISNALANLNAQLIEANRQKDLARREAETVRQQIQNVPPPPPAPEDQIPVGWQPDYRFNWYAGPKIAWIMFNGVSSALARIKDAYIISTLTGHREPLEFANATNLGERWKIDQVEPIPPGAAVVLVYEPKPPPSLPDFMSQWGAFEFHVVYDNKEYVKTYSQDYINSKMTREMPGIFGPRVTPRNDK